MWQFGQVRRANTPVSGGSHGGRRKKDTLNGNGSTLVPVFTDLEFSPDKELVENVVRLVEVEDDVEFANVAEVAVKHLHEKVYLLKGDELVVVLVYARHEK